MYMPICQNRSVDPIRAILCCTLVVSLLGIDARRANQPVPGYSIFRVGDVTWEERGIRLWPQNRAQGRGMVRRTCTMCGLSSCAPAYSGAYGGADSFSQRFVLAVISVGSAPRSTS
ncbi:hypothetical protein DL89DRAFT_172638 [Linderina pennispora]|uniref:Uncharacterized protein n=1 Tax=Linderina pennispora TaxID=61395 RepID=A0A1Y1W6Q0_9FUNG|nr:uncharacterized protein DL89DRAFT_172638 [Linderina pennispora]ORX69191.1 hypothetical protein DL89DRAFT_172638 [Linderina pennispora]